MSYDGLEIEMLSVGRADCILVSKWDWHRSNPTRVLIDGGNKGSAVKVRSFLLNRGARYIDHVICSHPHDDHAGGLVELVKDKDLHFGKAWVHKPNEHVDRGAVDNTLAKNASLKRAQVVLKSLQTAEELLRALNAKGVPIEEPFESKTIAFLKVCGPSEEYYEQLLDKFTDPKGVLNDALYHVLLDVFEGSSVLKSSSSPKLEAEPLTAPENNSSVILSTDQGGGTYLFTADAGAPALERAKWWHPLEGCRWMQIPHHGSRHNITTGLIEHFNPVAAYVSADGSEKHPGPAVVEAFKTVGTAVYSTHHPYPGNLRITVGDVPDRPEYKPISPL